MRVDVAYYLQIELVVLLSLIYLYANILLSFFDENARFVLLNISDFNQIPFSYANSVMMVIIILD